MTAQFSLLPGSMSLALKKSNDFATLIDFDTSLVGYSATASLTSLVTGAVVVPFTTSIADAATGQVSISLSDTQTATLASGTYTWQLDWVAPGNVQRTALSGTVEVFA